MPPQRSELPAVSVRTVCSAGQPGMNFADLHPYLRCFSRARFASTDRKGNPAPPAGDALRRTPVGTSSLTISPGRRIPVLTREDVLKLVLLIRGRTREPR